MSKFGSLVPSDKPYRVHIKLDGKPLIDKDKHPMFIDVYSEDSAVGRRFDREQRDQTLANARDGLEQPTQIEVNIAKCAALTAGWHLVDPDTLETIEVPFTVEEAKELYSLPNTAWIWVQVWAAANNHVNFIRPSRRSSSSSPSGTFAIAAE